MLFIPERHEALRGAPWSESAARESIGRIVDATCKAFDQATLWPIHPRDLEPGQPAMPQASLYNGAAGVVWAMRRLQRDGMAKVAIDFDDTVAGLLDHSRRFNAAAGIEAPSFLLGDSGVLLLQCKLLRDQAAADALFALAESNLHNPTLEMLWGSPGTMLAAIHMLEDLAEPTQRSRWQALRSRNHRACATAATATAMHSSSFMP